MTSLVHYAWLLGEAGRFDEAIAIANKAVGLDPFSAAVRTTSAQAYYLNRDFDKAKVEYEAMLELDRGNPSSYFFLACALEQMGEFEKAISSHERAIESSGRASLYISGLGYSLGLADRGDEARGILSELIAREAAGQAEPIHVAMVYIGLGDSDQAIDWLEKAFDARNSHMLYLKQGAQFDSLREDPRFINLVERMGW